MKSRFVDIALNSYDFTEKEVYMKIWASGSYKFINRALRNANSIEELKEMCPNIFITTRGLIKYARKYGKTKDEIEHKYLYRGMQSIPELDTDNSYNDKGFIATTPSKSTATYFTGRNQGYVFTFPVKHIGDDVRIIVINRNISKSFSEDEHLLLPGNVHINGNKCMYSPDVDYHMDFTKGKAPKIARYGGGNLVNKPMHIEAAGKLLVFWRAIRGRNEVDTFGILCVPKNEDKALRFMQKNYRRCNDEYEYMLDFIPEYRDLEREMKKNKSYELLLKLWSYSVNAALVDLENRNVETIHFQIPDGIFWEVCDRNRENEIKDAVLKAAKRRFMIRDQSS